MAAAETFEIEVVYALPQCQAVRRLRVAPGTTLAEAVRASGLTAQYPELDLAALPLGVFGRLRDPGDAAAAGDRVEIYRPLAADPKEARRRRLRPASKQRR